MRDVFVTDTISLAAKDWPQLKVVSIAPVIAAAIQKFAADGSLRDLYWAYEPKGREKSLSDHEAAERAA